jgi:hypothetical protein
VLQIHARRAVGLGIETDLDLARSGKVRLVPPLGGDLPGDHETPRRFPDEDLAPVALRAVGLLAVTAPACGTLENDPLHRCFSDVVGARPPVVDVLRPHAERVLDVCPYGDPLADRSDGRGIHHRLHLLLPFGRSSSLFGNPEERPG